MTSPSVRPGRPGNRETGHSVTSPSGIWKGQTGGQGAAGWPEAGTAQHGGLGAGAGSTRAPPRARRPPQLGHGARQCCQSQGLVPAVGPSPSSVPPHPLACGALGRLPPEPGVTSVLLALVLWNQGPAQGVWRRPWRIERRAEKTAMARGRPSQPQPGPSARGVNAAYHERQGSSSQWTHTCPAVTPSRPAGKVGKQSRVSDAPAPLAAPTGDVIRGQTDFHSFAGFVPKAELFKSVSPESGRVV